MSTRPRVHAHSLWAATLTIALGLTACATPPVTGGGGTASASPSQAAIATAAAGPVYARFVIPPPIPANPDRGEMVEEVVVVNGLASMLIRLKNVGEQPVTFLNTLYDYEPHQLYEPLVRVEWKGGAPALGTRFGRFFPSPAIVQPGHEAVYVMSGQPVAGSGQIGGVVSHIKFCPTRGMDDKPANPLTVSGLKWTTTGGVTTVTGTMTETRGVRGDSKPTIGVAFFDATGAFVGAVVEDEVGARMEPHERRTFEISGPGVLADRIASASGWAWVR